MKRRDRRTLRRRPDAHLDLRGHLTYADYLGLDAVLTAQHPRTDAHDELLFIVQHQATELWLKLLLHELHTVARLVDADDLARRSRASLGSTACCRA